MPPIKLEKKQQGFAVLTSAVLLSVASIVFTANMASSQLVDNQIIGNYYRNNEAFANAESGMNFVLGQLDDTEMAQVMLVNLPTSYESTDHHYIVSIQKILSNKISITSIGTSVDNSATREINLEIDFYINYPIPAAAVSANGKLNLDTSALVNDGCEGITKDDCFAKGNVADKMMVSSPSLETGGSGDLCSAGHEGENVVAEGVLQGTSEQKIITQITDDEGHTSYDWGDVSIPDGSEVGGISSDSDMQASSLFEATFGIEMNQDNLDGLWDDAAKIDMTNGGDCSDMLQDVGEEDEIIFIKGDCNISQYYAEQSKTSQNKVFTIGSVAHPKLVFIEGGTFVTAPNTGTTVVGMLYFLPSKHDLVDDAGNLVDLNGDLLGEDEEAIQVEDSSVDMGGINVNGALLSEYKCSHDGYDQSDNNQTKQHFSARFDKLILGELYSKMGMGSTGSGYRLSAGTWRDF